MVLFYLFIWFYVSKHLPFTALPWRSINHRKKSLGTSLILVLQTFAFCTEAEWLWRSWSWRADMLHCKQMMEQTGRSRVCFVSSAQKEIQPERGEASSAMATQKLCRWLQGSSFKSHQEGVPILEPSAVMLKLFFKYYYQKNN